jgi:hypothetical protein
MSEASKRSIGTSLRNSCSTSTRRRSRGRTAPTQQIEGADLLPNGPAVSPQDFPSTLEFGAINALFGKSPQRTNLACPPRVPCGERHQRRKAYTPRATSRIRTPTSLDRERQSLCAALRRRAYRILQQRRQRVIMPTAPPSRTCPITLTARLVRLQERQFSVAQKSSKALVEGY